MDNMEKRLIDWLLDKAAWWIKVVITVACISTCASAGAVFGIAVLALLATSKGFNALAWGYLIGGLGTAVLMLIFIFRTWSGYWPFYTKWRMKNKIRAMNFMPIHKEKKSEQV